MENTIAMYRKQRRMTQEQLAQKIGVIRTSISLYEQGKQTPPLPVALRISAALRVSMIKLFPMPGLIEDQESTASESTDERTGEVATPLNGNGAPTILSSLTDTTAAHVRTRTAIVAQRDLVLAHRNTLAQDGKALQQLAQGLDPKKNAADE